MLFEEAPVTVLREGSARKSGSDVVFLGALLLAMTAALVWQAWVLGVTVDEPSHLLSSELYWQGADRLKPRDLPPLIKIVCGWVPRFFFPVHVDFDVRQVERERRNEWDLAQVMMERTERSSLRRLFFFSRLPAIVFPLLTAALIWGWGRRLWGAPAGLTLAALYALEPTALGHGALVKNDIAATFGYLLFWFTAWSFWKTPSVGRAAALGGATLVALLAKMSLLWLYGAGPVIALAALFRQRRGARAAAAAMALVLLIPYVGTLAAYQFETRRISAFELNALGRDPNLPKALLSAGQIFRVLPMATPMWEGVLNLSRNNSLAVPVYLLGDVYPHGHRLYFLVALAVKGTLPLLLLTLAGAAWLARDFVRRRLDLAAVFWTIPAFLYIGLASLSSLQLGLRLILPSLPFGLLMAGAAVTRLWESRARALLVVGFLWMGVQAARAYPYGMAFFNVAAGGPEHGLDYLADSNLDWGQGLPELARYLDEEGIPRVRLGYFGNDLVWRYFRDEQVELLPIPWGEGAVKEKKLALSPGYYAVSATLLPGQFFPPNYRDYLRPLRERRPDAVIAHSIYIYRVRSDTPAREATGAAPELAAPGVAVVKAVQPAPPSVARP